MNRILLLATALLLTPAAAPAQRADDENTVTVSATGLVQRQPDQAVLSLAVESFASSAQEAARENARKMDALLAALRRAGIAEDRLRTTSYQLHPEYDHRREPGPPGEDRLIGYRAMNTVQVTIDSVPRVGAVIDAAVAAGANRVTGLSFQLRDPEAARHEAVRQAVAKARAEAEAIARALGRRLGPALAVSTGAFPPPRPFPVGFDARMAEMAPTPIEPGALDIAATVTAVYLLESGR